MFMKSFNECPLKHKLLRKAVILMRIYSMLKKKNKSRYSTETENFSAEKFLTEYSVGRESRVSVLRTLLLAFLLMKSGLSYPCFVMNFGRGQS